MSTNNAKCRLCRREGEKLFLKGERCHTQKCAVQRRNTPPGKDPKNRFSKLSEFGRQLREKQKAKRIFGVAEKVFRNYYQKASSMKGICGENLLALLERRLDNVVYRAGLADSRSQARQMVSHGIFEFNGRRVDIPSISVRPGDLITIREVSAAHPVAAKASERKIKVPSWIKFDVKKSQVEIVRFPEKDELEQSIVINLIVEFYSR
ncbi:MAG: 30S ribosomal protein S4 [Candidatus Gracilibacteria bacterium]|jgi:small subunit ribosomal protein S4|nr:30S ribosomal protein S4 [Candidatus Gracilibacteria bacterium]